MGRGDRRDERGGLLDLGEGAESVLGRDDIGRLEGGATELSIMHLPRARFMPKRACFYWQTSANEALNGPISRQVHVLVCFVTGQEK